MEVGDGLSCGRTIIDSDVVALWAHLSGQFGLRSVKESQKLIPLLGV